MTRQAVPPSPLIKDSAFAFVTGGAVCCLGQLVTDTMLRLREAVGPEMGANSRVYRIDRACSHTDRVRTVRQNRKIRGSGNACADHRLFQRHRIARH